MGIQIHFCCLVVLQLACYALIAKGWRPCSTTRTFEKINRSRSRIVVSFLQQQQPQPQTRRQDLSHFFQPPSSFLPLSSSSAIIDAEFERTEVHDNNDALNKIVDAQAATDDASFSSKSLLELSLAAADAMTGWNETRIPFVDTTTADYAYIDAKLAFVVDLDGAVYGIAVPFDAAAAVTLETPTANGQSTVEYVSSAVSSSESSMSRDDINELVTIMATQLQEHVSDQLFLKQTPRVLTITGPINEYIDDWETKLLATPIPVNELMRETFLKDESNDDVKEFHEFMRSELGDDEYYKTLQEDPNEISQEIVDLFSIPGLGDQADDEEGVADFIKSIFETPTSTAESKLEQELKTVLGDGPEPEALKLVSYIFRDGKTYSLVYMLKPIVLVGKLVNDKNMLPSSKKSADDDVIDDYEKGIYFELLTKDEEKLIIPRLESVCKEEVTQLGLQLQQ